MYRLALEVILELESFGLPLSWMPEGSIYQRAFGLPLSRMPEGKAYQRAFGGQYLLFGKLIAI